MKIKRLAAGFLACVLLTVNLPAVCFAAETDSANETAPAETAEMNEAAPATEGSESTAAEEDGGEPADASDSVTIPYASIEEWLAAFSEEDAGSEAETVTVGKVKDSVSSYLNFRIGSGMDCDIIGHLFAGDELEIIGENGDWYEVVVKERTGYVHKDYVDTVEQASAGSEMDDEMMSLFLYLLMSGQMDTGDESNTSAALTPDGNLTLVDDYSEKSEDGSGKQFITVTTKNGNYFYLVIDRDEDGNENVHFMNLVDEADLLALMDEDEAEKYTVPAETVEPVVTEPEEPSATEEPAEEPEAKSGMNPLPVLILFLTLIGGGGFFAYTKLKGKQKKQDQEKPDPDADYMDGEDDADFDLPDDVEEDEDDSTMFDAEDNEPV